MDKKKKLKVYRASVYLCKETKMPRKGSKKNTTRLGRNDSNAQADDTSASASSSVENAAVNNPIQNAAASSSSSSSSLANANANLAALNIDATVNRDAIGEDALAKANGSTELEELKKMVLRDGAKAKFQENYIEVRLCIYLLIGSWSFLLCKHYV